LESSRYRVSVQGKSKKKGYQQFAKGQLTKREVFVKFLPWKYLRSLAFHGNANEQKQFWDIDMSCSQKNSVHCGWQ
jgi:hypothetical protein